MSRRKLQVFDRYRFGPRSVLVKGDRFRVKGGPIYITDDGAKIPMYERGVLLFDKYCEQGAAKWIEAFRADGGGRVVLWVGSSMRSKDTDVYPQLPGADDDAAGLDNVLILHLAVPMRESSSAAESVTVRLQSEEFGAENFQYDDLDEALAALRRLYHECLKHDDNVQRQISILVGPEEMAED